MEEDGKEVKKKTKYRRYHVNSETEEEEEEEVEEEDSGYDISDTRSGLTTTETDTMSERFGDIAGHTPSGRALSRGSLTSSARPLSSEYSGSAWSSQDLLESGPEETIKPIIPKSKSADMLEMFADAEEDENMNLRPATGRRDQMVPTKGGLEMSDKIFKEFDEIEEDEVGAGAGEAADETDFKTLCILASAGLSLKDKDREKDAKRRRGSRRESSRDSDPLLEGKRSPRREEGSLVVKEKSSFSTLPPPAPAPGRGRQGVKERRPREERRAVSDPLLGVHTRFGRGADAFGGKRGSIAVPYSGITISRGATAGYHQVRPTVSSLRARYEIFEKLRQKEMMEEKEKALEEDEVVFPISRKTQTNPDMYQMKPKTKTVSRSSETSTSAAIDSGVNTEIDFALMTKLLEKLLVKKVCISTQTEPEKKKPSKKSKDIGVGTEKFSRERFSPLPEMRSKFAQTDASSLRSKTTGVSTEDDPPPGFLRRVRGRVIRDSLLGLSKDVQTDVIPKRDAAIGTMGYSDDDRSSMTLTSRGRGKGSDSESTASVSSYGTKSEKEKEKERHEIEVKYQLDPESSVVNSSTEEETSEPEVRTWSWRDGSQGANLVQQFQPKAVIERALKGPKIEEPLTFRRDERQQEAPRVTPIRREKPLYRKYYDDDSTVDYKTFKKEDTREAPQEAVSPPLHVQPSGQSQIPTHHRSQTKDPNKRESRSKSLARIFPKDLRTESKVIVEVINPRRRELSEISSFTEMQEDGKLSRKTRVTTSKKVPLIDKSRSLLPPGSASKTPEPIITSPPSTKAATSPVSKSKIRTSMHSVAPSECSTRPASVLDMPPVSVGSRSVGNRSATPASMLTPAFSDNELDAPKISKVNIMDPLHIVITEPTLASNVSSPRSSCRTTASNYGHNQMSLYDDNRQFLSPGKSPIDSPPIIWHETSSSTISNEMSTDPFKDNEGKIQKPNGISMTTETVIESKGKESKVQTKSRASRKFDSNIKEPAITTETTVSDCPPFITLPPAPPPHPSSSRSHPRPPVPAYAPAPTPPPRPAVPSPAQSLSPTRRQGKESEARNEVRFEGTAPVPFPFPSQVKAFETKSKPFLETALDEEEAMSPPPSSQPTSPSSPTLSMSLSPGLLSSEDRKHDKIKQRHKSRKPKQLLVEADPSLVREPLGSGQPDEGHQVRGNQRKSPAAATSPLPSSTSFEPMQEIISLAKQRESPVLRQESKKKVQEQVVRQMGGADGGGSKPGTEIITRIIKTSHPDPDEDARSESGETGKKRRRTSKMVLEQELQSGDGVYDTGGCRISSSIVMESPTGLSTPEAKVSSGPGQGQGVVIRELNGSGSLKNAASMDDLDAKSTASGSNDKKPTEGQVITETKFQRLKSGPNRSEKGMGREETCWEYSMECKCINGVNTSIRTNVKHKRAYIPFSLTQYESSV